MDSNTELLSIIASQFIINNKLKLVELFSRGVMRKDEYYYYILDSIKKDKKSIERIKGGSDDV